MELLRRKKQQKKSVNSLWSNAMPWYGPALFFIFTIILLAGLIFVVLDQAEQEKNDHLLSDISSTEENITDRLIGIRDYLILLSEEYLDERLDEIKFRAKSERFLIERSEIVSISFVDNEGIRQWVIPESKEHFEGTSLLRPNLLKAFEEAGESGHPIFSLPFISFKGESVVNLHVPVSNQKEVLGVIAAQISLKLLVENATYRPLREKYMITLEDDTGRTFISLKSLNQVESQFSESVPLSTMDGNISLSFTKYKTPVNWIIVILTVLCIGLICSLVWTMLTIGRDNFLRKQVQIQLEKAKKEAERANRAKSELIANISHEIRTPLGIIQGCTDLLHIYNNSEAEKEGLVKTIKRNSTCLLELVNDLLDLSKIEAGLLEIEKNGVSLRGLISSVHALFKASFEQKGIALIFNFKGSVPKEINTDANRLRQILINLIGNALKFTEKGQVSVDIQVLKNNEGEKSSSTILEISVCDTGIGMSELQKTKLFSPFSQGDSSISRNYGGSGLGLALSAKLARMLDGSIKLIASKPGKGSEFRLILLLDEYASDKELFLEPLDGNLQLDEYDKDSPSTYSLAGCTVLIVEDCLDNQRIYARFLEFAGAHVLIAGSGMDALEYANGFNGVILMDIQMPKMDGYETTRCMRKIGFRGPIIALTAHAMKGERQRCIEAGCDEYLKKPVSPDELIATVARFDKGDLGHKLKNSEQDLNVDEKRSIKGPIFSLFQNDPRVLAVLPGFINNLQGRIQLMKEAVDKNDWEQLLVLSHKLKGTAGNYGYPQLSKLSGLIEEQTVEKKLNEIIESLCELEDLGRRILDAEAKSKLA